MIVVDTSVWVEAFRGNFAVGAKLEKLMDTDATAISIVSVYELLLGVKARELKRLKSIISPVITITPSDKTWSEISRLIPEIRVAGEQFSIPDLLIGCDSKLHKAKIWSLDRDFARMAKLGIVDLI